MRPLRLLVVQGYSGYGGSEGWLLRLLDALEPGALAVEALLLAEGPLRPELEARGVPVSVRPVGTRPSDLVAPVRELAGRLRRDRPDVVLGGTIKGQLVAAPAGRLAGVPTVWAKHDHSYDRTLAAPLARLSTRVVAAVEELGTAARRRDVVVVPPPRPDAPPADRDAARTLLARHGVPFDGSPVAVMAGRLVPFKGVDDAVRALALPGARSWRLAVAGSDDPASPGEGDRLRALAEALGVGERVHLVGQVPDIAHWLAAFDALAVLTKRVGRRDPGREGFGTSAFEAMLAGVPVVAAGGGAVVRRLQERAGIAVPTGDPAAVAGALARLADPQERLRAGQAGQEITADHPDAAACARLLVRVLREAAAQRRASTSA